MTGAKELSRHLGRASSALLAFVLLCAFAPGPGWSISSEELKRYGFGDRLTGSLDEARQLEPPRREPSRRAIPEPVLPGINEQRDIPRPMDYQPRVISQSAPGSRRGFEGPTEPYRGKKARESELGFDEVDDFLFRPRLVHSPMFTLSERGLTGLGRMVTADVGSKNLIQFRAGAGYTLFRRSYGQPLLEGQEIEQFNYPFAYVTTPARNLETSLQFSLVDEAGRNFPLIADFETFGLMDVGGFVKYRFHDNPESRFSAALSLGMINGIKRVVTRVGSSGIDYSASLSMSKRIRNFGLHGEVGARFINGLDRTNSGVPDVTFYNLGVDLQATRKLQLHLELNGQEWQSNGSNVDASTGFKLQLGDNWFLDVSGAVNLDTGFPQGYRNQLWGGLQVHY